MSDSSEAYQDWCINNYQTLYRGSDYGSFEIRKALGGENSSLPTGSPSTAVPASSRLDSQSPSAPSHRRSNDSRSSSIIPQAQTQSAPSMHSDPDPELQSHPEASFPTSSNPSENLNPTTTDRYQTSSFHETTSGGESQQPAPTNSLSSNRPDTSNSSSQVDTRLPKTRGDLEANIPCVRCLLSGHASSQKSTLQIQSQEFVVHVHCGGLLFAKHREPFSKNAITVVE
ncbi:hypothetical protein BCR39DRAFT_598631 [Naematelia encephala]|uniref:Uncharacterized protein n=1 Tax=Naematelia encephala TaxID=71784 RepID=A0A1Y2B483_9TREE|nr:hypothetical protein BCR39DRAFT_598631 [Naematelia encephala]